MAVTLVNELVTTTDALEYVFKNPNAARRTPDELDAFYRIINAISAAVETRIKGPVRNRTYTNEVYDGGEEYLFLEHGPIVSVATAVENGTTLTENTHFWVYHKDGALRKATAGGAEFWSDPPGAKWTSKPRAITVTYTAGLGATVNDVPWDIKQAALDWILDTWTAGPSTWVKDGQVVRPSKIPPGAADKLSRYERPVLSAV